MVKKLAQGTNPVLASFYHGGPELPDADDPPHFRVSAEVLGCMMQTLEREYVQKDDNRRISSELDRYLRELTINVHSLRT